MTFLSLSPSPFLSSLVVLSLSFLWTPSFYNNIIYIDIHIYLSKYHLHSLLFLLLLLLLLLFSLSLSLGYLILESDLIKLMRRRFTTFILYWLIYINHSKHVHTLTYSNTIDDLFYFLSNEVNIFNYLDFNPFKWTMAVSLTLDFSRGYFHSFDENDDEYQWRNMNVTNDEANSIYIIHICILSVFILFYAY